MKLDKDYLIGQLEKRIADFEYYKLSDDKTKDRVFVDTSISLRQLKKINSELSIQDKKTVFKVIEFLKKLKRFMK